MSSQRLSNFLLRLGLGFALLYPPFDALSNPDSWTGYFPKFLHTIASDATLLHSFGIIEVVLAIWILSGKRIFWPTFVVGVMLLAIVFINFNNFEVLFRDITIATMAFALAVDARGAKQRLEK